MDYKLSIQGGQLVLDDDEQRKHFENRMKTAMRIEDSSKRLQAVAQIVYPPIRKVAEYIEWTQHFFAPAPVSPGEIIRIAQDEYTAVAIMTSPDGEIMYTRPWRKYTTMEWRQISCGLEIAVGDEPWGWDVMGTKMLEAAEELARKRDALRLPLLNAAAIANAGHIPTVATALSKASVDSIIKTSNTNGFPVTQVAVNTGTLMDMSGWTLPANSMVAGAGATRMGEDIFTKLFWNGYGNLTWIANHTVPSNYLYFSGPANRIGWFWTKGGVRRASEYDMDRDLDKHAWRQNVGAHVEGTWWVWRLQIT